MLSIIGEPVLRLQNFHPDTSVTGTKMEAVEIVIDNTVTTCVIRKIVRGSFAALSEVPAGSSSLNAYTVMRRTAYTKKGFVGVLITTRPVQFYAYIHIDHLQEFVGAYAMSIVRNTLKQ